MQDYESFVSSKLAHHVATGLPGDHDMPARAFPFQRDLVTWALRRGRAAIFASTGLGKTLMQCIWADVVASETSGRVLILAPLAVAQQTLAEATLLGIPTVIARDASGVGPGITITNYDRLHKFDGVRFSGVVLDESSIIKHHDAKTFSRLVERFRDTPYKLAATATPAPNDFTELGTHAEFLGVCSRTEMLAEYFTHDGGDTSVWRLKGHARTAFWRWVASWGALVRSPSDLGYEDGGYALPPLIHHEHILPLDQADVFATGRLFAEEAAGLMARRQARRASLDRRVAECVRIVTTCTCGRRSSSESTSEPTTSLTPRSTGAHPSSKLSTTPSGVSDTQPTSRNGKGSRRKRAATESSTQTEQEIKTSESTGLRSTNTSESSLFKDTPAPSADALTPTIAEAPSFTLTTATSPVASEESSAPRATLDSASSVMTQIDSIEPRCTCDASEYWVIWCDLNDESDALADGIPGSVEIRGSMDIDSKEAAIVKFGQGKTRVLVTKPSMTGFGLNWQHAARMAFVGVTDSFEAYFQAVRREWRFGQTRDVHVHVFASEAEGAVVRNLQRKGVAAEEMAAALSTETAAVVQQEVRGLLRETNAYTRPTTEMPRWLTSHE